MALTALACLPRESHTQSDTATNATPKAMRVNVLFMVFVFLGGSFFIDAVAPQNVAWGVIFLRQKELIDYSILQR